MSEAYLVDNQNLSNGAGEYRFGIRLRVPNVTTDKIRRILDYN